MSEAKSVEQYIAEQLQITSYDLMGDEMPLDSSCGNACKLAIDAAKLLIDELLRCGEYFDCNYYPFLGHLYGAFGDRSSDMDILRSGNVSIDEVRHMAAHICQCYIFG